MRDLLVGSHHWRRLGRRCGSGQGRRHPRRDHGFRAWLSDQDRLARISAFPWERQRNCIARAILKDTPIVILGEATSALDPEQAGEIPRACSAPAAGRTLLVIAHDLPSIVLANQIVLLNDGKIEASGTHETLLESSPTYRRLSKRSVEMRQWQIADDHR